MMKTRMIPRLSILVLFTLTALLLASCGISQEDYDAVVARADGLAADKANLETQVASLTAEKSALEIDKTSLEADKTDLQTQVDTLTGDKADLQADKANLETDKVNLQADKASLAADLAALQHQYDTASADLADLNAVYPPRQFSSRSQLENWLSSNDVSDKPATVYLEDWYTRALELQRDALADGYIISVDYDYYLDEDTYLIYCTTVISGIIYYWDPEDDTVYAETGLVGVENPGI